MTSSVDHPRRNPAFSLIIATMGPAVHLRRCLDSLVDQTLSDFNVIVVDQNAGDHILHIIEDYRRTLSIMHLRSAKGLSRARNQGLASATGDLIAFPDDDCWYGPKVLAELAERFVRNPTIAGFSGRCLTADGRPSFGFDANDARRITKSNVWNRGVSSSIFFWRAAVSAAGGFNESLGLGSATPFQSGEETDLLLRVIGRGFKVQFDPSVIVHHPIHLPANTDQSLQRAWSYGLGMGRVLRIHSYSDWQIFYHVARPFVGVGIAILKIDIPLARLRLTRARGRLNGWRWAPDHPEIGAPRSIGHAISKS